MSRRFLRLSARSPRYLPTHTQPRAPHAAQSPARRRSEKTGSLTGEEPAAGDSDPWAGLASGGHDPGARRARRTRWIGGQHGAGRSTEPRVLGYSAALGLRLRPRSVAAPRSRRVNFLCFRRLPLGPLHAFHIPDLLPHLPPLRALVL